MTHASSDPFHKCYQYTAVREAQTAGVYPYFVTLTERCGTEVTIGGRQILMMGSNDYLGLSTDPRVISAASNAVKRYGASCTGSRLLQGTLAVHEELEERLAAFLGKDCALVFTTGFQANIGVISCLAGRNDSLIVDKGVHASIIDGCRLTAAKMHRFVHNDPSSLNRVLASLPEGAAKIVALEGVYSATGDIARLSDLAAVSHLHSARVILDDAHGLGVLGGGRGTAAEFGLTREVDLIVGTFSKALASIGGFAAGDRQILHYIQHHARSMLFSASLPPGNAAAALAALDIVDQEPDRVERLERNATLMRKELRAMGFRVENSRAPIIPLVLGGQDQTLRAWRACFDEGLYVNAFVPPAVAGGSCLLRLSCMATHTDAQITRALELLGKVSRYLGLIH